MNRNLLRFKEFVNESFLDSKASRSMGSILLGLSGRSSEVSSPIGQEDNPDIPDIPDEGIKSGNKYDNWSNTVNTSVKPYLKGVVSSVWNGSGKPKITIDKADSKGFGLTYLGDPTGHVLIHAKGGKGDTIHQACIVLEKELNKHLKWLEADEILVKPDYSKISLKGPIPEGGKMKLSIDIPLLPATKESYINRFKRRGGWGHPQLEGFQELKNEALLKKNKRCDGVHTYTYPSEYQSDKNKWKNAKLVEHFMFWKE